jgi:PAS domain S-box-containing protein
LDGASAAGAGYAIVAGVLVLLICTVNQTATGSAVVALIPAAAHWPEMAPLTALTAGLCAAALIVAARDAVRPATVPIYRSIVLCCSTATLLLAVARVGTYPFNQDFGLDALGSGPLTPSPTTQPGTMASATVIVLILISVALLLNYNNRWARTRQATAVVALLFAWAGLPRYFFGGAPLLFFNQMALQTSVATILLSTGVLALRANYGLTALLVNNGPAGVSIRRLLPAAAVAPLIIGALALYFEKVGALGVGQSYALVAITSGLVFAGLVWQSSAQLERMDLKRKESDARFRSLAESLPQLIWTCNARGRCDYLSKQWEDYTGLSGEGPLAKLWLECVHPEDRPHLSQSWVAAARASSDFLCEFRLRRHDGEYRWFAARGSPQKDAEGRITRWYGATTDIDDQRHAQEAQMRSQKMEALGTLAGGIAHDFNNILLAISGNTTLALEDLPPEHPARSSLFEVERASRRAADLVRRILSFSRKEEPRSETLYLQPVIEEALKLLRPTLPAQVHLRASFGPDVPPTVCDATQIHQILMNLSTNAAHAIGHRPGSIDFKLNAAQIEEQDVTTTLRAGTYACLQVTDDGCGMSHQTLARIFDPFFTTKQTGTGLGLSMVHGIMKAHGGTVTVYSEPGRGTEFKLYFPASTCVPTKRIIYEPPKLPQAAGQRVLYVDDDDSLVILTTRRLTRLGYTVTGETDPEMGLVRFLKDPGAFDAVVSDLSMPGMPGFDLVREILKVRPQLPVIMTSGFVRPEDQKTAAELGVRALILKPNTDDELARLLDRIFRGESPPAAVEMR